MNRVNEGGFTLVEILVSVVVAVVFIGAIAQAYIYLSRNLEWQKVHAAAMAAANVNLEKYRTKETLKAAGFDCSVHKASNKFTKALTADTEKEPTPTGRIYQSQTINAWAMSNDCEYGNITVESVLEYKTHPSAPVETARQSTYAR